MQFNGSWLARSWCPGLPEEVSGTSAEFEFHLKGASAPEGQLDADHLLAIVSSLKEIATKIGRA